MTLLGRIFHTGCERTTTKGRAAKGLAVGTLLGGGLTSLAWASAVAVFDGLGGIGIVVAIVATPVVLIVWAVGLFLIGAPGWAVLHALGARCQQAAMIYGGGLTLTVLLAFLFWDSAHVDRSVALAAICVLGPVGVAVGWVVAKIAYAPPAAS